MRLTALIQNWGLQYLPWFPSTFSSTKQEAIAASRTQHIVVVSASVGAGHVRAAEALCAGAALRPSSMPVKHLDAMEYVPRVFRKLYADLYIYLVNYYPGIWGYVYRKTDRAATDSLFNRIRKRVERAAATRLKREILALRPQAIICTHFMPAEILSDMRGRLQLNCPVWVQVTDFDLHKLWVHPHVSGYFVANHEISYLLQAQGVPASAIHVTGIPVMPSFSLPLDRNRCAAELGLDPTKMTLLLSGGGNGVGRLDELAARLLPLKKDLQLIVMAGRNKETLDRLQRLSHKFSGRLVALGYTKQVERVMACCDFAVIKPGGLTTSECLVMGLPMVLSSAIPGQEERNADFLLEQGVACKATQPASLEYRVLELIDTPAKLNAMRAKAKELGKGRAALDVLHQISN